MNTPKTAATLQVKRLIKSTRESVFAAWTKPNLVQQWFGPPNCRILDVQMDLRVGGKYRFKVFTESMGEMSVSGEYREMVAPTRLVFTWQWEDDSDWEKVVSVVTVEFAEKEGGTEVVITHEGLPSAEHTARHEHGWTGCLDKLEARAAVSSEVFGPGRFCWNELLAGDVDSAAAFYTKLLGWETAPMAGGMPYTLFKKNGNDVAGLMKLPMPGVPPHWLSYIHVEAVDAAAARVTELGGKICAPPFDIPKIGRIAIAQDPQGAAFGLFQPAS